MEATGSKGTSLHSAKWFRSRWGLLPPAMFSPLRWGPFFPLLCGLGGAYVLACVLAGSQALRAAEPAQGHDEAVHAASGKLFICGGGRLPDDLRQRFIDLAGGAQARIVVITTASVLADTDRIESKLGVWREQALAGLSILHTRSRVTADQPDFYRPLAEATGVWFVGGDQNWLIDTYRLTATEREIRGVLARGGVVGGTSAGAAIMSPVMIRRDRPTLQIGPGFGFLPDTVVDQHFLKRKRKKRLLAVLEGYPKYLGLGIDEGTALVVDEGGHLCVFGESQVTVCWPPVADQPDDVLDPGAETELSGLRARALARHEPKAEPEPEAVAAADPDSAGSDSAGSDSAGSDSAGSDSAGSKSAGGDSAGSKSAVSVTPDDMGGGEPTAEKAAQ